jgi:RNA polymerase sigma factor (sigma-70 family)
MFGRDSLSNPEPLVRRVYAYVAYRMGDGADAEDATSEVFERALRYRSRYDSAKGPPAAWLIGIARRVVDGAQAERAIAPDGIGDEPSGEDLEGNLVRRMTLTAALNRLKSRDRELIALRYGADLTSRQIAELLELSPNTVDVALHRALGRLRTALEDDEERDLPVEPSVAL